MVDLEVVELHIMHQVVLELLVKEVTEVKENLVVNMMVAVAVVPVLLVLLATVVHTVVMVLLVRYQVLLSHTLVVEEDVVKVLIQ